MKTHPLLALTATLFLAFGSPIFAQVPPDSVMGAPKEGEVQFLLNPMEPGSSIHKGGYRLKGLSAEPAEGIEPKFGKTALRFGAEEAGGGGSKGDFGVDGAVPGEARMIGMWVYLDDRSNVSRVGVQVKDAEDEWLLAVIPADWFGWQWCEFDLGEGEVKQAYPQKDKDGQVEFPLGNVRVVWWARDAGSTHLTVDMVTALTSLEGTPEATVKMSLEAPSEAPENQPLVATLVASNFGDEPVTLDVNFSLQENSSLYSEPAPNPKYGSNHAHGAKSWYEVGGQKVEDNESTDGKDWTAITAEIKKDGEPEVFQYVDLGQVREVSRLTWLRGNAGKAALVDVEASVDGKTFQTVEGLVDVDQHNKWGGERNFPDFKPFKARVVRYRYHTDGTPTTALAMPAELGVYDGVADESGDLPQVGRKVAEGQTTLTVPARSFASMDLPLETKMGAGSYLLGVRATAGEDKLVDYQNLFGALPKVPDLIEKSSRIGLNTSKIQLVPQLRDLGIGWVRFENMKWPFVSDAPHRYAYDGSVGPWHLDIDKIFQSYHDAGFGILTYMFMTPEWASDSSKEVSKKMRYSQPPKDPAFYGEFCFQTAARYGSKKHPASELLTEDKKSGLDLVTHYEMWNEPNLNPKPTAGWGGWAASMDEYYEMMRYGAEGVKRADPDAIVTSAGYGGMTVDTVDGLRTYTYADGKHPVDFVDLINVHYYSGRIPPEISTSDGNANLKGTKTFVENLQDLVAWRDEYASGRPIWMTETGYDSAGPFGTDERVQAARLPRMVMLCLANGVEKVFVYRESGSRPSKHMASGVMRIDFTPKPSYYTFGTLVRQFHNVTGGATRLPHPDPNLWLMEWKRDGQLLLTAWTVNGTAPLAMELGPCEVTDAFGATRKVDSTKDMTVGPFPLYLSGVPADHEKLLALRSAHEDKLAQAEERHQKAEKLRKYLFDFGKAKHLGQDSFEGVTTPYLAVDHNALWDDTKGYGFNVKGLRLQDRGWMGKAKLDRDGVKTRGNVFEFRVEPGTYNLSLRVEPFGDPQTVSIGGVDADPANLDVTKKEPTVETSFTVTGQPAVVEVMIGEDYATLCWIRCVEKMD